MTNLIEQSDKQVQVNSVTELVGFVAELWERGFTKDYFLSDDRQWLLCDGVEAPIEGHNVDYLLSGKIDGVSFDIYVIERMK